PSSCRVVGEVDNEMLVEAAEHEVHSSGVRPAPLRSRTWCCPVRALDRYGLAHYCGELLANRSLEYFGCHIDQTHVLPLQGQNRQFGRVADTCVDVVLLSFLGNSPRSAIRRSRRRRRRTCPCRERGDTRSSAQSLVSHRPLRYEDRAQCGGQSDHELARTRV